MLMKMKINWRPWVLLECQMVKLTENSMVLPQKSNACHVSQQFHVWVCTQKNRKQRWGDLAATFLATECLISNNWPSVQ